ncbi:hypothetical protein SAMN04488028_103218 [Reichenbachiella agariperforans]|uniref:Outer membrane protein beta-barrel domain-containing protein n=2 Tax=Reichenbachiella agariperforans TaxID=156994 RepID=A0A1M6Q8Y7_REIAG|nr:hypothetical protein SAMN04488028_103218 [Reichenbachiella agariperforans]
MLQVIDMKKLVVISLFFALMTGVAMGQSRNGYTIEGDKRGNQNREWMDKVYVGGGIGSLFFSDRETNVGVSVLTGYRWTEKLNTGVGLTYQYYKWKPTNTNYNDYGVNVFAQYAIYPPFFLMAQYEYLNLDYVEERRGYDAFFVGGGYSQNIGGKAAINFYALYNVTYRTGRDNGRYASPWSIGVNIMVGF